MIPITTKPKRKIKNRPEQDLQISCVRWFRYQYPNEILIHIPNGGRMTGFKGSILKTMGVLSGFPDLALFKQKGEFGGLIIEMKAAKEKTSTNQNNVIKILQGNNYKVEVVDNFDRFRQVCNEYLM